MHEKKQRLTALALAFALALSPSTFADVSQLERDMARVFGRPASSPKPVANDGVEVLVEAMNRERAAHGLGPLRLNAALSDAARDRIADMFEKRYFAHVSPDGIDPFVWAARRGYRYRLIGENLAVGYAGTRVVDGWMRSPGHRENILGRGFDEVGIAVAPGAPQRGYKGPTVVAMYGRR
ncbi:MAG TPA: CAP domain-containing protein [Thermoanaerobaculia bacterium]|nr:CAP domain-containing protein [Thermoanaerobaculia bacterium]